MADETTDHADDKPKATRDAWDGVHSEGVTIVSTDASPEQIAKTLGVELEPAPAAEGETPAVDAKKPAEPVTAKPAEEPIPEERPKGKTPEARIAQARFDERQARRAKADAEARAATLERELAEARAAKPTTEPAKPAAAAAPPFPTWEAWQALPENDGKLYEDYSDARSDWRAKQNGYLTREEAEALAVEKARELREADVRATATAKAAAEADARSKAFLESREAAKTAHEDYVEVVEESDLPTNPVMDEIIQRAGPQAGELMYYLGSHPEDCQRIAALTTVAEVIEQMTRIKLTLESATESGPLASAPRTSRAPAPPEPVGTGRQTNPALALADPRTPVKDFIRIRNEQERARQASV